MIVCPPGKDADSPALMEWDRVEDNPALTRRIIRGVESSRPGGYNEAGTFW